MSGSVESGFKPHRLEFVRESEFGVTPDNPSWLKYSPSIQSITPTPTANIAERRNIGDADVVDFFAGAEDHELELEYDLHKWFVDGGGNALDASGDGLLRDANNELPASHTVVMRGTLGGTGADNGGSRLYVVARGAKVNSVDLNGDPGSGEPVTVTLNYLATKKRQFRVDQPGSATTLDIASTDAGDTSQSLTIESDDAGTTEVVSLNGTTVVTTTASFDSIDAVLLDAQTQGDVTVSVTGGPELARIRGLSSYQDREGDLGIPLLGSGDRSDTVPSAPEIFLGDTITRGSGFLENADINSASASVQNNIEATPVVNSIGQQLNEAARDVTFTATVFGPKASFDSVIEHLTVAKTDIVWTMTGGSLTFPNAVLTGLGSLTRESEQAVMTIDNTFTSQGITVA